MDTTTPERELELRDYLRVIRRRKLVILATVLLVGAMSLGASLSQQKVYEASAEVLLQTRTSERILVPGANQSSATNRISIQTEIEVMRSRSIADEVAKRIKGPVVVHIAEQGDTELVVVSAESPSPEQARIVADTYAEVYITTRRQQMVADLEAAAGEVQRKVSDLDQQLAADGDAETGVLRQSLLLERANYNQQLSQLQIASNVTRAGGAQLVSRASTPSVPIKPTTRRNVALGLMVGLAFGAGLAFLREYLDDSIKTKEEFQRAAGGLTVLGLIPAVSGWRDRAATRLVSIADPSSPVAEAYRSLRTSIQFLGVERPIRCIQVTSASPSEGKTTTLANLGVALARSGQRVLVVCCDLRRPRIHEFYELSNQVGLTSVLVGEARIEAAVQSVPGIDRLFLLASGPPPPNPSEVLSWDRTDALFKDLRTRYDVVLIDSPPVLPVTDAIVLAGVVDATVVVGAAGRATRRSTQRTIELLQQVDAPLVGLVLNGVSEGESYGDGYGYRYGYRARDAAPDGRSERSKRGRRKVGGSRYHKRSSSGAGRR